MLAQYCNFLVCLVIHGEGSSSYADNADKVRGLEGGQMLTLADVGGRGGYGKL